MTELVFSTLLKNLKEAFSDTLSDEKIINLLCDSITLSCGGKDGTKCNADIDKSMTSKILNRKKRGGNLPKYITQANYRNHYSEINEYFKNSILPKLDPNRLDDLLSRIIKVINNDTDISDDNKKSLIETYENEPPHAFLANVFLYTLTRNNVRNDSVDTVKPSEIEARKKKSLTIKDIPDKLQRREDLYIAALFAIYAQANCLKKFDSTMFTQYPSLCEHFNKQRKYYFAAESLNEEVRDVYGGDDEFNTLKSEILEGTEGFWEVPQKNGMDRLGYIMRHIPLIQIHSCSLTKETNWVNQFVKKGICHFLVNDGSIEGWIKDDDEQQPV